jgi:hypothetical protein
VSPILGIFASSQFIETGDYQSIATTTVGAGGVSSITFSSIPSTFTHLQLRTSVRNTLNYSWSVNIQLNGATNYSRRHRMGQDTNSGTPGVFSDASTTLGETFGTYGSTSTQSLFGGAITDILDYTNTNKNKTIRSISGWNASNGGGVGLFISSLYETTSAITSLVLTPTSGNFAQYSSIALYGIKG